MVDELTLLLDDYSDDVRPYLQYTRGLLAYRQSSPDADDIAKAAILINMTLCVKRLLRDLIFTVAF